MSFSRPFVFVLAQGGEGAGQTDGVEGRKEGKERERECGFRDGWKGDGGRQTLDTLLLTWAYPTFILRKIWAKSNSALFGDRDSA